MSAALGIAHLDGMAADHVRYQFLGAMHAKMRALLALAGQKAAVAETMRHKQDAGFLAFLHDISDGQLGAHQVRRKARILSLAKSAVKKNLATANFRLSASNFRLLGGVQWDAVRKRKPCR